MNAKEIIIKTLASRKLQSKSYKELAESILALRYPCKECEGRGYTYQDNTHNEVNPCYYCKGTGKGEKVLAVLDEEQALPEQKYFATDNLNATQASMQGYSRATDDMLSKGWKKTIEE
jgi:hypothetical protein